MGIFLSNGDFELSLQGFYGSNAKVFLGFGY